MEWSSDRHSGGSSRATWNKIGSGGKESRCFSPGPVILPSCLAYFRLLALVDSLPEWRKLLKQIDVTYTDCRGEHGNLVELGRGVVNCPQARPWICK